MNELIQLTALVSLVVIWLLVLVWRGTKRISLGIAHQTATVNAYLEQIEERLQDIQQRLQDNFQTDEEREH